MWIYTESIRKFATVCVLAVLYNLAMTLEVATVIINEHTHTVSIFKVI